MLIRLLIGLLIICTSCQVGKIPCPKIKSAKLHKTYHPPASSLTAKANIEAEQESQANKNAKPADVKYVKNISVEEWDCPRPGAKKYMPKSVKDNIKKNRKKFEADLKQENVQIDSLSSR